MPIEDFQGPAPWEMPPKPPVPARERPRPARPPDRDGYEWLFDKNSRSWILLPKLVNPFEEIEGGNPGWVNRPVRGLGDLDAKYKYKGLDGLKLDGMIEHKVGGVVNVQAPAFDWNFVAAVARPFPILVDYPKFPGWIAIGQDAPIENGDVGVLVIEGHPDYRPGDHSTPEKGWDLSNWIGSSLKKVMRGDRRLRFWCAYRKELARCPNLHFSKPLPLP